MRAVILIVTVLYSAAAVSGKTANNAELKKLVKYVTDYINFTSNYVLPEDNSELVETEDTEVHDYGSFDFIIVGAGSSGTILARRLSEYYNWSVLLLEAGKAGDDFTDIPAMNGYLMSSPYNWGYKTTPQRRSCLGMIDQRCAYATGKGLGGSSIIGDMIYARGNKADFDEWAAQGNPGWSYEKVLPYFKKTETHGFNDYLHSSKYHGYDGILSISFNYPRVMNYKEYREASELMGLKYIDINGPTQIGFQEVPWTIKGNQRQTGGNAFVQPVMGSRINLNVTLEAFVTNLLFKGTSVTGVQFVKGKKNYKASAKREVILSAGAINSAQILMLSGIGPEEELRRHDIPVKLVLPVGKNLTAHPAFVGMVVRSKQTAPSQPMAEYLANWLKNERPFTSVFNAQHISFINTKTGQEPPNVELISMNPPTSFPYDTKAFYNFNNETQSSFGEVDPLTDYLIQIIVTQPKSRGTVTLQSSSPRDFPLIDPAYYMDDDGHDLQTMYEGVQFVLEMLQTKAMQYYTAEVKVKCPQCDHLKQISHKKYWYCIIQHQTSTIGYPTGTTRMGVSPDHSVVDQQFRVHGVRNLRVCDGGAMPTIVSGHPLAAIVMMGERLAHLLKEQYG